MIAANACFIFSSATGLTKNRNEEQARAKKKRRNYSYRRATIGSTFVARRAGIQQTKMVTPVNTSETAMNVN